MSAHCDCDDPDPVIREMEIKHGAPEGTTSRTKECSKCWGLIKVIG